MICRSSTRSIAPLLIAGMFMAGCTGKVDNAVLASNSANAAPIEDVSDPDAVAVAGNQMVGDEFNGHMPTDDWVGRWNGPEGLFLDIQTSHDGKPGHYALANKDNLDRQADYSGVADGATIRFVRDGKDLAIRPGTGDETGFKYLAGKQDCLIVIPGKEGYCR